jgi:ketosteroid isomerase-like protein
MEARSMTHDDVQRWLDAYVAAWRAYDRAAIGALFSDDASYAYYPYDEPVVGRDAIVARWLSDQDAPDSWTAKYEPVVVEGDRAVARGESRYTNPDGTLKDLYYNVYLLRFDGEGRCSEFIEYFVQLPERLKGSA